MLWATISGGHQSWTHTGTTAKAEEHNVNKSRTIRCIKTSPAFIIEESFGVNSWWLFLSMIGEFEQSDAVLPGGSSRLCPGSGENGYTAESSVKQVCILLSHFPLSRG